MTATPDPSVDNDWSAIRRRMYRLYRTSQAPQRMSPHESARAPFLRQVVRRHLPTDRQAMILDVGCGDGALVRVLHEYGYSNVEGVDESEEQVRAAAAASIDVRQGDLLQLVADKPDRSCDVVITFDVIEHLSKPELWDLAQQVVRILRDGGRWIIHAPNAEALFGARVRYADWTHQQAFTRESITQLLIVAGFRDVACHEDKPVVHGAVSGVRRILWEVLRLGLRLCWAVETGNTGAKCIFSQNLLAIAVK